MSFDDNDARGQGKQAATERSATALQPQQLTALRERGHAMSAASGPFVDPRSAYRVRRILADRGEEWAAAVLSRKLTARSRVDAGVPWLREGELETLDEADRAEDDAALDGIADASR
ncbi:MAG: hypothetical protein L0H59_08905 [Tomitella sp.]|nr:hypothetical protein [Tomitella sp.]